MLSKFVEPSKTVVSLVWHFYEYLESQTPFSFLNVLLAMSTTILSSKIDIKISELQVVVHLLK